MKVSLVLFLFFSAFFTSIIAAEGATTSAPAASTDTQKSPEGSPAASGDAKTEAPKTEAPKTEAPKTEAPKTEAPKTDPSPAPAEGSQTIKLADLVAAIRGVQLPGGNTATQTQGNVQSSSIGANIGGSSPADAAAKAADSATKAADAATKAAEAAAKAAEEAARAAQHPSIAVPSVYPSAQPIMPKVSSQNQGSSRDSDSNTEESDDDEREGEKCTRPVKKSNKQKCHLSTKHKKHSSKCKPIAMKCICQ